jgi:ferredoxin
VVLAATLAVVMLARMFRGYREKRVGSIRLTYPDRVIRMPQGVSVLEASLRNGVPHAHVCGGRGRCSTCRIRILSDLSDLPPMSTAERTVLEAVAATEPFFDERPIEGFFTSIRRLPPSAARKKRTSLRINIRTEHSCTIF